MLWLLGFSVRVWQLINQCMLVWLQWHKANLISMCVKNQRSPKAYSQFRKSMDICFVTMGERGSIFKTCVIIIHVRKTEANTATGTSNWNAKGECTYFQSGMHTCVQSRMHTHVHMHMHARTYKARKSHGERHEEWKGCLDGEHALRNVFFFVDLRLRTHQNI